MTPPQARAGPATTKPKLQPSTVLPTFRADLLVTRSTPGVFDVKDPVSGKTFQLYDFELSLARMMNGVRRAAEVVEEGARLGIPVTLESLEKFGRQLHRYGFLGKTKAAPANPVPEQTWDKRNEWDPALRELCQSGIRLLRVGKPAEARDYFEAMLQTDPQNPEALEMLALADHQIAHGAPGIKVGRASTTTGDVPVVQVQPEPEAPARKRRPGVMVGAFAATVLILGTGWASLRSTQHPEAPPGSVAPVAVSSVAVHPSPALPNPSEPGVGAAASVLPPVPVPAAPPPKTLLTPPAEPKWSAVVIKELHRPSIAEIRAPVSGRCTLEHEGETVVPRGGQVALIGNVSAGSRRALAAIDKKISELEPLAAADPIYADFLERARAQRKQLSQRNRSRQARAVLAPADGLFVPADLGSRIAVGGLLGKIVDATVWEMTAVAPGQLAGVETLCKILDREGHSASCRIVRVASTSNEVEVVAQVSAIAAPWLKGGEPPTLQLAARQRDP